MKKYIIWIIISIIVIVAIAFGIYFFNMKNIEKILEDENNQVNALKGVYEDFLGRLNLEEDNIILDESCLRNIISGVEFSDENKEKLKEVEKINEEYEFAYDLSLKYNVQTSILTLKLEEKNHGLMTSTQSYKLSVKNGAIVYETDGVGETINTSPVSE